LFERGSKKGRSESDEENFRGKEKEKKKSLVLFIIFMAHYKNRIIHVLYFFNVEKDQNTIHTQH